MAATNQTVKSCPTTTGYRFEPTGTYRPFDMEMPCPPMTMGYPVDMTMGYFPAKTYSSIFNKPSMPIDAAFMPRVPSTMTPAMPSVYERPAVDNWTWPAWNQGYANTWMPTGRRMPFEWTMPSSYPISPVSYPTTWVPNMMTARPFEPIGVIPSAYPMINERRDLMSCTPFERILYRFLNTVDTTLSALPKGNEWLCTVNSRPTNPIEFYCLSNPIRICDREGNRELCLCFDLRGYKPEEINVTLNKTERCIIVEACHDIKEGKEHHVTRKYFRKFVFPESLAKIDLAKCDVKSWMTREGFLNVECPLPRMTVEEIAKCPVSERYFRNPMIRDTVCPSTLNTPVNTKPVNVKMC